MLAHSRIRIIGSHLLPLCPAAASAKVSASTGGSAVPEVALIVGGGPGLSSACARLFSKEGFRVAVASRNPSKDALKLLTDKSGIQNYQCDCADPGSVASLFQAVTRELGSFPNLVVFNASARAPGPITTLDASQVKDALLTSAYGGFNVAQQAAIGMTERGSGSLLFTGASASYKGYANSSSFAMGKFGLHGLAQSLARELGPKGIHVAHFPIDGGIGRLDDQGEKTSHWKRYKATTTDPNPDKAELGKRLRTGTNGDPIDEEDTMLHPDAIAQAYLFAHRQHRSAWTFEFQLRPWQEKW